MHRPTIMLGAILALACANAAAHPVAVQAAPLPEKNFSNPPEKPHDVNGLVFKFDQLEHWYRVPGEFTYRLDGDKYGLDALSFIITVTHPGGGPGLHTHDTEEAHVLLEGTAQYRIGDKTFTVQAPYIARVPAGVQHTFINAGTTPFNLIAVLASRHPVTTRIGPNPLISANPAPAAPKKEDSLIATLSKQADRWDKAIVRKDRAAIEANMAEDFRQIDSSGNVETKASFVADLVSPEIEIDPYTVEDFDVRIYGNVALLSGRTKMTGRYQGKAFDSHYRYIDVYVRTGDEWKIVSVQTSKIPK